MRETSPLSIEDSGFKPVYNEPDDEIDLFELARVIWSRKWFVVAAACLATVGAIIYLNFAAYRYTVTLKVVPVEQRAARVGSQFSGLASLAGISLPSDSIVNQFDVYKELLTSQETADKLSRNPSFMKIIFANEWSEEEKNWKESTGVLNDLKDEIKSLLGIPLYPWRPPDGERLKEFLERKITIAKKGRTNPITLISIDVKDVSFGKDFLWSLHEIADASLRARALERSARHIDYIREQLTKVTVAEYRQALIDTLSHEEKAQMMASSGLSFAADPLGEPTAPSRPSEPKPARVLILSTVFGLIVGTVIVVIVNWMTSRGRGGSRIAAREAGTGTSESM